ncbi:MAG: hypothetical protein QW103_02660 [Candidatus Pacearchaeota archaeon]
MVGEGQENTSYDIGFLITSLEEKINSLKEKINLVAKGLVELREDIDKKIDKFGKENLELKFKIEDIKRKTDVIFEESSKFVKRSDLILIERMLKDFQPLEFVRKKDLEEFLGKNKEEGPL